LSDAFQEERVKKVKRSKAKQAVASTSNEKPSTQGVPKKGLKFTLLDNIEA